MLRRSPRRAGAATRGWAGERGSQLLEAAVVTPLLFTLLLGAVEGGFALAGRLSVANMSLAGARTASGQASEPTADHHVLQSVRRSAGSVEDADVTAVIVYRALGPDATVPLACTLASVAGLCNRYTSADLARPATDFGCVGPPGPLVKADASWCPTTRKTALSGTNGPPDYVGVYVQGVHHNVTRIFGASFTFRSDTVLRIEPRTFI